MNPVYRVVFDTNVLVSASRPKRAPQLRSAAELVAAWRRGDLRGVSSNALTAEYRDVLGRAEVGVDEGQCSAALSLAADADLTEHHDIGPGPYPRVSKDIKDDHLFALIDVAEPDYLCSKDVADVLDLHIHRDTVIVSPGVLYAAYVYDVLVKRSVARK